MTNSAGTIWPHLAADTPITVEQRRASSPLAAAMYPSLTPQAKSRDDWRERDRQKLLEGLRQLNQKIDARLQREGK
jgi:hypothetical protein